MNKQSLFFTALVALVATMLMLMAIQFLAKRLNIKQSVDNDQNFSLSYFFWFTSLVLPFYMYLKVGLTSLESSIEILISPKCIENALFGTLQRIAINVGFTFLFTFIAYSIVASLLKFTYGSRKDSIEIENNNYVYFIVKALLIFCLVFSTQILFEDLLKWFSPIIDTPFFH